MPMVSMEVCYMSEPKEINIPLTEGVFDKMGNREPHEDEIIRKIDGALKKEIYPRSDDMLYPPDNFFYDYVPHYVIQFYIFYIDIKHGVIIHRYTDSQSYPQDAVADDTFSFDDLKEKWEKSIGGPMWDFKRYPDDVAFLGESKYHYWMLYYDQDVSDCSICRVSKSICSYEDFLLYVKSNMSKRPDIPFEIIKLDGKGHFVIF